ncbi:MAG: GNAT family N-acetyltransferase [Chloroflexota bacterium]
MYSRWKTSQANAPEIVPLTTADLARLQPRNWSLPHNDALETLGRSPELAFRVIGSNEYVIGSRWRRRAEIVSVEYLKAGTCRRQLLQRLLDEAYRFEAKLVVVSGAEQAEKPGFYRSEGFSVVDEIVRYQRQGVQVEQPTGLCARRLAPSDRLELLSVDHEAFPWLWWNSDEEFTWYLGLPGVEAHVALSEGRIVGYTGFTITGLQGHLDRLAVHPNFQGNGLGKQLVLLTLDRMAQRGVVRVALTTQVANHRSARLYHSLGFVRTNLRFPLYGRWLTKAGDSDDDPA